MDVKGQDLFKTREDAEKAMGKTKGYDVRPVPVGAPMVVTKPKGAPAEVARKRAVVKAEKPVGETAPADPAE